MKIPVVVPTQMVLAVVLGRALAAAAAQADAQLFKLVLSTSSTPWGSLGYIANDLLGREPNNIGWVGGKPYVIAPGFIYPETEVNGAQAAVRTAPIR
jgi:hypothetical protein